MTTDHPSTALPREFLEREEVADALGAHDFGTVFQLAKDAVGISYSSIAAACDIKPERVGALARGVGRITSFDKISTIADALRIPGRMVGLLPREWEPRLRGDDAAPARRIATTGHGDDVRRRKFFRLSAGAGLAVSLPEPARAAPHGQLGSDYPEYLRRRTARLRRMDDILGGGDTYRVYLGEYQETKRLLRDASYTDSTGKELLSVLAEQAQQAGWAAFDHGKHADASSLYHESYRAATEAGDSSLAGNALAFLGYQKSGGQPKEGVEDAASACRVAAVSAPPSVQALLYERLAWAYAVAGDATETQRALAAAEAALAAATDSSPPDWAAWVDHNELRIMQGRCWAALRRPLRAIPILEQALRRFDDIHARDKSLYLTWLADSYLAAGEVEKAAEIVSRVLDLSAGVASVRPRQRIAPALHQLEAHSRLAQVREVLEKAGA
ncbi:XRE family transcriptional regulator [Streptomyces sp. NPDC045369]|uniref:XRE family transcriptional regulator n=1 Tax=Streptomyces sp. NPDC045369 TaxID=3155732 RepID=UPI0033E94DDC